MMNTPKSNVPVESFTTAEELLGFDWSGVSGVDAREAKADEDKRRIEMLTCLTDLQAEVIDYQEAQINQEVAALKFQLMVTNWIVMATIVMGLMLWLL